MNFSGLCGRYAQDVHRFALYLCGNQSFAEDLTSETFVRALCGPTELRPGTVNCPAQSSHGISIEIARDGKEVRLSWRRFASYRASQNSPLSLLRTISGEPSVKPPERAQSVVAVVGRFVEQMALARINDEFHRHLHGFERVIPLD